MVAYGVVETMALEVAARVLLETSLVRGLLVLVALELHHQLLVRQ
jgi:hypothetical protein